MMVGLLRKMNPDFYSDNQEALGEASDWDEALSQLRDGKDADAIGSIVDMGYDDNLRIRSIWSD